MAYMTLKNKKRITIILITCSAVILALLARLIYIQVIKSDYYKQEAYEQQTRQRDVSAKRGKIYDATGQKVLAQSISVSVITAVPNSVENKEAVAQKLSEILGINKDEILSNLNKRVASVTIAEKVDQDKATQVLKYISDQDIGGLRVDEDTKRIYPYGDLLSQVLGFTGTDNQGLYGLELYYDDYLKGVDGKIVGSTDGKGRETPFTNEQYVAPIDGKDLFLTVDATIQSIVEKYLKKAYKENECQYATATVIRPKTGEVLAMSSIPTFDPNSPFAPTTDELKMKWNSMSIDDKNKALQEAWRNKAISDAAEPGSTFKVVTTTAALEENVVGMDDPDQFYCSGSMNISGWTIKCWRYPRSHGSESLRQGIMNSCNPVFMQVSQRVGISAYCKYLDAFNLNNKTGIDLPGEATGIMHDPSTMTPLDLATTSFGQTIEITALQTAVNYAAIANGGYLIRPYVVKEIKNSDGSFEKSTQSQVVKQIMSKKNADSILSALEDVVKSGTGKAGQVKGYRVAGKTGTAEESRGSNKIYMGSFVGIAPVNDPEVVVVITIYNPQGKMGYQGSTIAAPVAASIIDETLRYLDIKPDYTLEENNIKEKVIPDLTNKTVADAINILKDSGFNIASDDEIKDSDVIKEQIPKSGASLMDGSTVRVYIDTTKAKQTVEVPDLRNKTLESAKTLLKNRGLNVRIIGTGTVIDQDTSPGEVIDKGSIITIKCVDTTDLD